MVVVCVSPTTVHAVKVRSLVGRVLCSNTRQHIWVSPSCYLSVFETFHRLLASRIKSKLYLMAYKILHMVPTLFPKLTQYPQWLSLNSSHIPKLFPSFVIISSTWNALPFKKFVLFPAQLFSKVLHTNVARTAPPPLCHILHHGSPK